MLLGLTALIRELLSPPIPHFKGYPGWDKCLKLAAEALVSASGYSKYEGFGCLLCLCFSLSPQLQNYFFKGFSGNCEEGKNEVKFSW